MTAFNKQSIADCQVAMTERGLDIPLLRDAGPTFCEPWQAQAFAMTLALHDQGLFTWATWAETLGQVIKDAQRQGDPDHGDTYYRHWLTALETVLMDCGAANASQLHARQHGWLSAAARTPHGQPIELSDAEKSLPV